MRRDFCIGNRDRDYRAFYVIVEVILRDSSFAHRISDFVSCQGGAGSLQNKVFYSQV